MKASVDRLLHANPGRVTEHWPDGERFAGVEHRFFRFTPGFAVWVVFWGPEGGE